MRMTALAIALAQNPAALSVSAGGSPPANLDTAAKRMSAIDIGLPWRTALPIPDGSISQADRQTVALHYGGVLAT